LKMPGAGNGIFFAIYRDKP